MSKPFVERVLYTACPLCGSDDFEFFKIGNCSAHPSYKPPLAPEIIWNVCNSCRHVFAEGYYTDEALGIVFEKTQSNQNVGNAAEPNRPISARMIQRVLPYQSGGGWLDVGFGNGSLLFTADEFGFDVVGLDLRASTVAEMLALGFEAHQQDILDFSPARKFSVVSLADVLEHTPYPPAVLKAAAALMTSGGALLISLPNSESFVWRQATDRNVNPFWGEMEHYHNFGRTRLYELLRECGFEPRSYGVSERYRMCMEVVAVRR